MTATDQDIQIFPVVERCLYRQNPLFSVICQVRFPSQLRLEATSPMEFQELVQHEFPFLDQGIENPLSDVPEFLRPALGAAPRGTVWKFASEDRKYGLDIQKDRMTLQASRYSRWEDFYAKFELALQSLLTVYDPPFFVRAGLRYRDAINRAQLGLLDVTWSDLLKPHIVAELGVAPTADHLAECMKVMLLDLPSRGARARIQHGLAEIVNTADLAYLIDCDFFVEQKLERTDVGETLGYLHTNVSRFFRWCISDRLHEALGPEPISD